MKQWSEIPYEDRLLATQVIFEALSKLPPISFRKLIYEVLYFESKDYETLYTAGGLHVTNAMNEYKEKIDCQSTLQENT